MAIVRRARRRSRSQARVRDGASLAGGAAAIGLRRRRVGRSGRPRRTRRRTAAARRPPGGLSAVQAGRRGSPGTPAATPESACPGPGADTSARVPPSASTRKRMPSRPCAEPGCARGVEADAVVAHRHLHLAVAARLRLTQTCLRLGVLGDVGDGLLHQAVDHQLGVGLAAAPVSSAQCTSMPDCSANSRARISSAATSPRLLSDDGRRSSMMRRFSAMPLLSVSTRWLEPLRRLGRRAGQARLDARRVELGRGEQRAEFVVQVARQAAALVFARRLQVVRQLGQLRGALRDLDLEPVALGLHQALLLLPLLVERRASGAGT